MDYASLPHFCRTEGSGSSRRSESGSENCYSLDHPFHQELYNYIKEQSRIHEAVEPIKQGSFHVDFPEPPPEEVEIAETIQLELHKFENCNGVSDSLDGLKINGDWRRLVLLVGILIQDLHWWVK